MPTMKPTMNRFQAGTVRKAFGASTEPVGDRQIRVRISTGQVDRAGDVVVQKGIRFDNFQKSRTVLWNHDQDHPVAQCLSIALDGAGDLEALTQFPDAGVSAKSDEVYGLLKAGVINAASIGFMPVDVEPMDGKNPRKGLRIASSELLEFSFVSVPANPGAEVVLRAFREGVGAAKPMSRKGLYAVSQLAYILHELGFLVDAALGERAREGDESSVPDQLHAALTQLGAALVAMTSEEVAELLAERGAGLAEDDGDDDDIILLSMLRSALGRTKEGMTKAGVIKAGRKFSAETTTAMRAHLKAISEGHQALCDMLDDTTEPTDTADDDEADTKAHRARRLRLLTLSAA